MTFKFLHVADVHLDTTFLCRTAALRERLRDALRTAFERSVDTAIDESVHAVLIAGDLFDGERLSFATEQFLLQQLHRLDAAGIVTVYATGNHDPGGRRYRGGRLEWPPSFHFISDASVRTVDIDDRDGRTIARVVGAGHATEREESNLASTFPPAHDGLTHVGLLHTYVTTADQVEAHDRYAPSSLDDLRMPGYQYWALGHIHKRQQLSDRPHVWYSGNIQGRHARETGAKGGLLVTIDGSGTSNVRFLPFAPIRWEEMDVDGMEEAHTFRDVAARVANRFDEMRRDDTWTDEWMLRVRFHGRTPLAESLRDDEQRGELETLLADRLGVLDVRVEADRVAFPVDVDGHRDQPHVLAAVLDVIDEARVDDAILDRLAPEPLARELRTAEERRTYLRSLLDGLDLEAASRLLDE